ncbi:hypothetical protein IMZ48_40765, partial [Candidatus Bathyarchaeota archaeon]|nr:hypothetical protein [Candidatus Bathyarchaeota archaeon]
MMSSADAGWIGPGPCMERIPAEAPGIRPADSSSGVLDSAAASQGVQCPLARVRAARARRVDGSPCYGGVVIYEAHYSVARRRRLTTRSISAAQKMEITRPEIGLHILTWRALRQGWVFLLESICPSVDGKQNCFALP